MSMVCRSVLCGYQQSAMLDHRKQYCHQMGGGGNTLTDLADRFDLCVQYYIQCLIIIIHLVNIEILSIAEP